MTLDDIDIANPDAYREGIPHAQFALLRREAPVFRHREANGPGFWALTKHDDIARVARDPARSSRRPRSSSRLCRRGISATQRT